MVLNIISFILLAAGAIAVFSAGLIVKRFELDKNVTVGYEHSMEGEELEQFKLTKAVVKVKLIGILIMLPGLILVLITFR